MLTEKEEQFIQYWSKQRSLPKKDFKEFVKGLSSGLLIGIGIILLLITGWYQRANMDANSKSSPVIIIVVLLIIAVFMGFLYQNYRWEANEQQYLELLNKKKKAENQNTRMQDNSSQQAN